MPGGWDGQRIVLRFDAATHRAVVWVDDEQVAEHEGGYTPFEADITALAQPGERAADHGRWSTTSCRWQSLPPGDDPGRRRTAGASSATTTTSSTTPACTAASGCTPRRPPTSPTSPSSPTSTARRASCAARRWSTAATTDGAAALRDADGDRRRRGHRCASGELRVADAELWRPGRGYLYDLTSTSSTATTVVDRYPLPVGIRTVRVDGTRFLINGEPFYFRGFGMHEDHAGAGQGPRRRRRWSTTSRCSSGSAPTRSARRTTPTPRRSSTTPTGSGSSSSTRPPRSGSTSASAAGLFLGGDRADLQRGDDRLNDPRRTSTARRIERAHRPGQEPPLSVVLWCIANEPESAHRRVAGPTSSRCSTLAARARPDPAGRVRQHDARAARRVPGDRARRRRDGQPLLRLVHRARRPRDRRAGPRSRAAGLGRQARQADHHHRVRRRHHRRAPLRPPDPWTRGVPGRPARHLPPRLRPRRRGRRRARLELRRLPAAPRIHPRRRQQEGRVHA